MYESFFIQRCSLLLHGVLYRGRGSILAEVDGMVGFITPVVFELSIPPAAFECGLTKHAFVRIVKIKSSVRTRPGYEFLLIQGLECCCGRRGKSLGIVVPFLFIGLSSLFCISFLLYFQLCRGILAHGAI